MRSCKREPRVYRAGMPPYQPCTGVVLKLKPVVLKLKPVVLKLKPVVLKLKPFVLKLKPFVLKPTTRAETDHAC
jgi:hypothetical protein